MATKKTPIKDVEEASVEVEAKEVTKKGDTYDPMEPVERLYFKDNGKYKDDIFVGYNGVGYIIKRGVKVLVPRVVDEIIQQSMQQNQAAVEYSERMQAEYEAEAIKYV